MPRLILKESRPADEEEQRKAEKGEGKQKVYEMEKKERPVRQQATSN